MDLSALSSPLDGLRSGRFLLVGYLPVVVAAIVTLILVWSGAPLWLRHGDHLSFKAAWKVAAGLGIGEMVLLAIAVTLVGVILVPLQLALMRVLEGNWPTWLGAGLGRWWHRRRKEQLVQAAQLPQLDNEMAGVAALRPVRQLLGRPDVAASAARWWARPDVTDAATQRAGRAGAELRRRYPLPGHLIRPTALGNALTAIQDTAGREYGLDAVVAWPRLYPVLGDRVRAVVDDRRDIMDGAGRMAVICAVTTVSSVVLLWGADRWWLLALIPAVLALVSYWGAVAAALSYGDAVRAAFDLHRFDLYAALRLAAPRTRDEEFDVNQQMCAMWRQGVPPTLQYRADA